MNNEAPFHGDRWPARERLILSEHQLITTQFVAYFASVDTNWRVLDVGCGDGFYLEILRNLGFQQIYGMDEELDSLDTAHQKGLSVLEGSIYELDVREQIDAIVMCDVLEHLDNQGLAITKIYDALKVGGILYLILPVVEHEVPGFWSKMRFWSRSDPLANSDGLTTDSICWLLRSHQLEVDEFVRTRGDTESEEGYSHQWLSLVARKTQRMPRLDYMPTQAVPTPERRQESASVPQEVPESPPDDAPTVIEPRRTSEGESSS